MENHNDKIALPPTNINLAQKLNHAAAVATIVLSLIALVTVLTGYLQPPQPRETDEGPAAHIFQLSILALFPAIITFLSTADWKKPWRSARPLVFSAATLIVTFAALFYLEHYR